MLVAGEASELVDVLPHSLVRRVEEVGPVGVHLDAGLGVFLAVGVAAEVVPALDDSYREPELRGSPLSDGQAEEARANDNQVCHRISDSPRPPWRA